MLAIVVGLVFIVLGLWGVVCWWTDFLMMMRGSMPVMIVFGGSLAVIAGITSIKDSLEAKNEVKKGMEDKEEEPK